MRARGIMISHLSIKSHQSLVVFPSAAEFDFCTSFVVPFCLALISASSCLYSMDLPWTSVTPGILDQPEIRVFGVLRYSLEFVNAVLPTLDEFVLVFF